MSHSDIDHSQLFSPQARRQFRQVSQHRRVWAKRLGAILFGCMIVVAIDWLCGVLKLDAAELTIDPYSEIAAKRPLFVPANNGQDMETSEARLGFFRRVRFSRIKPLDEFRIFVVGGSTVQGHPYSIETSFPSCLQTAAETASPSKTWNVVNCGGVSYASYRLVPVVAECLQYDPDLIVFCEGHNEFLEDVTYEPIRRQPPATRFLGELADKSHLIRLLRRTFRKPHEQTNGLLPSVASDEVDALLNHDGGLQEYHRDDAKATAVEESFRANIIRMSSLCRDRGVPLLLVCPVSNLADCPPFKSQFSDDTTEELRAKILKLLSEAQALSDHDLAAAIRKPKQPLSSTEGTP